MIADLNHDALPDLTLTNASTGGVRVYLATGYGTFSTPESTVPLPDAAPFLSRNGGVLTLDRKGQLLRRDPRHDSPSEFSPPENVTAGTGSAIRQLVFIRYIKGNGGAALARDAAMARALDLQICRRCAVTMMKTIRRNRGR